MISFHNEDITFILKQKKLLKSWIEGVVTSEKKSLGEITYVFCSDEYLLKLNIESLDHDFYTDIITFDYCENGVVSGDLFISIDRVKDNAISLKNKYIDELHRVMIHGVLHLCGYGDKTKMEEKIMREKEDFYLAKRTTQNSK